MSQLFCNPDGYSIKTSSGGEIQLLAISELNAETTALLNAAPLNSRAIAAANVFGSGPQGDYFKVNNSNVLADDWVRMVSTQTLLQDIADIIGVVTVVVTATSVTASAGQHIHVTAAGQTITLPSSPVAGDTVTVSVEEFYDTLIARNGKNIMGLAEDFTIDQRNFSITFTYISATRGWQI